MAKERTKYARKPPRQERSKETVHAILEASVGLLREEGMAKFSTVRLRKRAGVSAGTLYQYFPTREALRFGIEEYIWEAILIPEIITIIGRLRELPLEQAVPEFVRAVVTVVAREFQACGLGAEELPEWMATAHHARMADGASVLSAALSPNLDRVHPIHPRLGMAILIQVVVQLTKIGVRDYREDLRSGAFQDELARVLTRYLVKDAATPC